MRWLEALTLVLLFVSACTLFQRGDRRPRWVHGVPIVALVLVLLHLGLEGARWQMIPAYGLTVVVLSVSVAALKRGADARPSRRMWPRAVGAVGAMLLIAVAGVAGTVLPVFDLPAPSGAYAVGTHVFVVEDTTRLETITPEPDDYRALVVRAWYPAETPESAARMTYMPPGEAAAFAQKYGLPSFMTSHLRYVETHAFEDAPVATGDSAYPVLLFSHGYNVPPSTYASLLTEVASQGFVVFAVNHTYESTASVFPDGRVATFHHEHAGRVYDGVWEHIQTLEARYWAAEGDARKLDVIHEITDIYPMSDTQRRWADDLSFVVDELERRQADDTAPAYLARLDLQRVGAFGHSAGGATAGQALLMDARIRAGANWDGAQWGDVIDSTLTHPFLRVETTRDSTTFAPNDLVYGASSRDVVYTVTIDGAGHGSFSDIPFLIPLPQINGSGTIEARRATEVTLDYTLAFFRRHLLGADAPLLQEATAREADVDVRVSRSGADVAEEF